MKSIKALFVTAMFLTPPAMAQQRYKAASDHAMYCATDRIAVQVLTASPDLIEQWTKPDATGTPECAPLGPNDTFTVLQGNPSDDSPKQIAVQNSRVLSALYIAGPIVPTSELAPPTASSACSPGDTGPAGEVDRLEAAKDGTLKLKRYLMTSRCVKGQMRASWKHLN